MRNEPAVTPFVTQVRFPGLLADSSDFPYATVRVTPTKVPKECAASDLQRPAGVFGLRVDHARTALYLIGQALQRARVWLPAYHCPALVEPLIAAGCAVAFYPLTPDLRPHPLLLDADLRPGDAVVGIRFFGFDNGLRELAKLCREHGLLLIEDLAHATYFDDLIGDVGCTSLVKFLPLDEGGELLLRKDHTLTQALVSKHSALNTCRTVANKSLQLRILRKLHLVKPAESTEFRYFHRKLACRVLLAEDNRRIDNSDHAHICSSRRDNYRYLAGRLRQSSRGECLMPELPGHVVPYVLPFLLHSATDFMHLRKHAIQALRWEESAPAFCPVSDSYRDRLVQLPINQDLGRDELDAIADLLAA